MTVPTSRRPESLAEGDAAAQALPLSGFTVGMTAARRRDELAALLERRGARVVQAPALRIVPLADDQELHRATLRCLEAPVDIVVATTGIGFRGWFEAGEGWGVADQLRAHLATARVLARGPKARGAVRAVGLVDAWSPASESSGEVLEHLLGGDLQGRRVVVQLHGEPLPDFVDALTAAGAEVVTVPVYRWEPPEDLDPLLRMVELVTAREVDAITFTSAPAAASLLRAARGLGLEEALLEALRTDVLVVCVGPVTAAPLERAGVRTFQPERSRLGALVREVVTELPRRSRRLPVSGHVLEVRGHAALVDGRVRALPPGPLSVLRALAVQPGRVVSRADLLRVLPGGGADEHAVEMAVGRLRTGLGDPRLVQTVVKRGYRLNYQPERDAPGCLDLDDQR